MYVLSFRLGLRRVSLTIWVNREMHMLALSGLSILKPRSQRLTGRTTGQIDDDYRRLIRYIGHLSCLSL